MPEEDLPCVWTLKEGQRIIQVGSSSSLNNMWKNDIKKDIVDFFSESGDYSKLRTTCQKEDKDTYQLTFYEVNVQEYLKGDTGILGEKPENPSLLKAYSYVLAAYVEGKLGYDSINAGKEGIASMYNKSTLDGYFYDYFEEINKK
jgi:hypothetical protein